MRHLKKKFARPMKPWEKQRILDERALIKEYAYKNKREIWRVKAHLNGYRNFAKTLVSIRNNQQVKEKNDFLKSLFDKGVIKENASVEDVLALTIRDISERRLQTLVFRKGLAKTPKEARQFIAHGRIAIGERKVRSPSVIVSRKEEELIRLTNLQKPSGDKQ
ncbi:MAG TPA: 30S ribosomal protein S4 [Candidatus Nanoarchaeia archaeon]|nr:30S ribosomal protein S4 [Candidatus Nanoarchaeia archaeon]